MPQVAAQAGSTRQTPSTLRMTSLYTISGDEDAHRQLEGQHDRESSSRYLSSNLVSTSSDDIEYLPFRPSDASALGPLPKPAMTDNWQHSARAKRPRQQLTVNVMEEDMQYTGETDPSHARGSRISPGWDAESPKLSNAKKRKHIVPRSAPPALLNFSSPISNASESPPVIIVSKPTRPLARALTSLKSILRRSNTRPSTAAGPSAPSGNSDVTSWLSTVPQPAPLRHRAPTPDIAQTRQTELRSLGDASARRLAIYTPPNSSSYSASNTSPSVTDDNDQRDQTRSTRVVANVGPSPSVSEKFPDRNAPRPGGKPAAIIDHRKGRRTPSRAPRIPPSLYDKTLPPPPSSPRWTNGDFHNNPPVFVPLNPQGDGSSGVLNRDTSDNTFSMATQPPSSSWESHSSRGSGSLARSDSGLSSSNSAKNPTPLIQPTIPDDESIEFVYHLSLNAEELSEGGEQKFQITRLMLNGETQETTILVDVRPGCKSGTRITFPGAGNELTPGTYRDVVFVVEQIFDASSHCSDSEQSVLAEKTPLPNALGPGSTLIAENASIACDIYMPGGTEDIQGAQNETGDSVDSPVDTPTPRHIEPPAISTTEDPQPQPQPVIQEQAVDQQVRRAEEKETNPLNTALMGLGRHRIPLEHLEIHESSVIGRGGFGVVTRGKMLGYHSEMAVKRLTSDETRDMRIAKRLVREMKTWSKLEHRNILSLIGFHLSEAQDLALIVCPLQPNGNVKDYLQRVKPSVLERLELALDTLSALEYLHNLDPPVVHGDIKSVNVLVGDERQALLCDFGLTLAADEVPTGLTTSKGFKGSVRYCSPELVMHEEARRTVFSDMWAWGCLLVEIMKETIPYPQLQSDFKVVFALTNRVLPESEELLINPINIWSIVQGCWQAEPGLRSTAETSGKNLRLLMASRIC